MIAEMTYLEAEEYIYAIPKFTKKNSMETTGAFYKRLGEPGAGSKIIHVAGTNGKGSVCAYLQAILMEAGHSTAMFTSPHLVSMLERFQIGNTQVTQEAFLLAFQKVMQAVEAWNEQGTDYHPTFFETLFFIGMLIFEKEKPEYIILETGLGGRLDATNVVMHPVTTIITKIGMDHMEYLGDTLPLIAGEKAGILKKDVPVVFWDDRQEVTQVIRERAESLQNATFPVKSDEFTILKNTDKSIDFSFKSKYYGYIRLTISSCAIYQMMNAALAIQTIEVVDTEHLITKEQIMQAVRTTKWEGRMEEVMPDVIVDGAHNEDGIEAFLESVDATANKQNQLLFAVVSDKDYDTMIEKIVESGLFSQISITKIQGNRVVELEQLEKIFLKYKAKVNLYEDVSEAFRICLQQKKEGDRLYIAGSLYLVGLIKEILSK